MKKFKKILSKGVNIFMKIKINKRLHALRHYKTPYGRLGSLISKTQRGHKEISINLKLHVY